MLYFILVTKIHVLPAGCLMIHVTKLNEADMVINCELIEMIESTPDTTVTMNTGRKIIVKEPVNVMLERIIEYKRKINIEGII